jgi:hypothetical protein
MDKTARENHYYSYDILIDITEYGYDVPLRVNLGDWFNDEGRIKVKELFSTKESLLKSLTDKWKEGLTDYAVYDFNQYYEDDERYNIADIKRDEDKIRNEVMKVLSGDYQFNDFGNKMCGIDYQGTTFYDKLAVYWNEWKEEPIKNEPILIGEGTIE